jgi:hypothetical protein
MSTSCWTEELFVLGGRELIEAIDSEGYDWLKIELGLEDAPKL